MIEGAFFFLDPAQLYPDGCVHRNCAAADTSREVLLSLVPPLHSGEVHAGLLVLAQRPTVRQLLSLPLGCEVKLEVVGVAADHRSQVISFFRQ